jgi:hypothetical protein
MKFLLVKPIVLALIAIVFLGLATGSNPILAQGTPNVEITFPTEGQTLSGVVNVVGTINFPDFLKYEIFLKSGDNLVWVATVFGPVTNGLVARMDTRVFADGTYQLIVRQVHPNSQYEDFAGPMLTLQNNLGAPRPFPEFPTSPLYAPPDGALLRVENCSGTDLEFDYTSPEGFCSADALWIMARHPDDPLCVMEDFVVLPCEYRGTAWGTGEDRAFNYSYIFEAGKIYEILFPGGGQLFINEIPPDDPAVSGAQPAAQQPPAAPQTTNQTLPVSGQATSESAMPFVFAALGLISFLVIGGVIAMRRDKQIVE